MRSQSLRCPTCGSQALQDRSSGAKVPWLVEQDAGTRALMSWLLVVLSVLLFATGAFLAVLGITGGAGLFVLAFFVLWGLLFARFGLYALRAGRQGLTAEPTELACLTCRTTWHVGDPARSEVSPPPAPGTSPSAPPSPGVVGTEPALAPPTPLVPPAPPVGGVSGVVAPGIAELELFIRSTVPANLDTATDDTELERQRIDAVRSMARIGHQAWAAGTDGGAARDALIRLLSLDTGYVPEMQVGAAKHTMHHAVIDLLAEWVDPAVVDALVAELQADVLAYEAATTQAAESGAIGVRRLAVAEDRIKATAEALGRLGDPRALPALRDAQEKCHFGMKRAAKRAIHAIESRRAA